MERLMGGLRVRCGRCGHRLKFQIVSTRTFVIKSNIFSSIFFLFYRNLQLATHRLLHTYNSSPSSVTSSGEQ